MKKQAIIAVFAGLGCSCLQAAPIRVSIGLQTGVAQIDAGSVDGAGYAPLAPDSATSIRSGSKVFAELTAAVHFNPWFSLEAGYAALPKFSSQWMRGNPDDFPTTLPVPDARLTYRITSLTLSPVFRVPLTPNLQLLAYAGLTEARARVSTLFLVPGSTPQYAEGNTVQSTKASYHAGAGFGYALGNHAILELRVAYYDLGHHTTMAPMRPPGSNHITATTETLGLSWLF